MSRATCSLRARLAGAIRVESERAEPGLVRQKSPFAYVTRAGPDTPRSRTRPRGRARGRVRSRRADAALGEARVPRAARSWPRRRTAGRWAQSRPTRIWNLRLVGCHEEAVAVALAEGASLDAQKLQRQFPRFLRRRDAHLDAEGLRRRPAARAGRHRWADRARRPPPRDPTPATDELVRLVEARLSSAAFWTSSAEPPFVTRSAASRNSSTSSTRSEQVAEAASEPTSSTANRLSKSARPGRVAQRGSCSSEAPGAASPSKRPVGRRARPPGPGRAGRAWRGCA